jgi:hypothetical protein
VQFGTDLSFMGGLLIAAISNGCGSTTPDNPPKPPPPAPVVATGDGTDAGGYFGPAGGELQLGPGGPSVVVPRDPARTAGSALGLKKDTSAALPAGAIALGSAFRPTAELEPPSNVFVEVRSSTIQALPSPCSATNLELAVQGPQQAGPGDGGSSPALAWTFRPATWQSDRAIAKLTKLSPYPLQFVCARPGGTP